jgi:ATP-binding cassette, subfamily C, bacterial LapB
MTPDGGVSDHDDQNGPAGAIDADALALALAWLTRHHGRERSPASLFAGVPRTGPITAELGVRALNDAGYNAAVLQRPLADLHPLLLPAVLLLDGGQACVLLARESAADGAPLCRIVMFGAEPLETRVGQDLLAARHDGRVIVATPLQSAAAEDRLLPPDPARHWLWGTLRRFVPYYRSALLAAMLSNLLMLVTGLATSVVFDKVIPHQAYVTLWALATAAALAVGFDLMARQLRAHLIDVAGRKVDLVVGALLFRQTLGVRLEHRPASAGAYAHTLAQIEVVREFFASATLSALSDLPFIVIFVVMVFAIAGPLGWVLAIAIPLLLLLTVLIQGTLRRAMAANMQQQADLHGVLVEAVEGLEDLKAAGAQGRFQRLYETSTAAAAETALRSRRITALATNLSAVAQQAVTVVMLVWGVYLIGDQVITGGALIGAVMFAGRAVAPLSSVVMLAMRFQGARAAMTALDAVMRKPLEREVDKSYVARRELSGRIALHEVAFAYPAQPGAGAGSAPQVLKGISLGLRPGERVAILGRIGSGKSTVLRLLAGLYQPSAGHVEVDGIDLRQIDPADFRARVGFVGQEPRLFNGTLRDNVLLDRPAADPGRLADAARLTGLDRVAAGHPLGWDLPVGESGGLLSGGQRQLVALTRCLVTMPQILLMDEPTSSMDAQSEAAFLRQLHAASGERTLVMVTHRPAVLALVQRVVVVDGGRVVLDGPKDAVLAALSGGQPAGPAPASQGQGGAPGAPGVATVANVAPDAAARMAAGMAADTATV